MSNDRMTSRIPWISLLILLVCAGGCSEIGDVNPGGTANPWDPSYIGGQNTGALCVGIAPQGASACSVPEPDVVEEDGDIIHPQPDIDHPLPDSSTETGEEADAGSTEDGEEKDVEGPLDLPDAKTDEGESSSENGTLITFAEDVVEEEDAETGDEGGDAFIPDQPGLPSPPSEDEEEEGDPCEVSPGTCLGNPVPVWEACDFQPQSCGHDKVYGLSNYAGTVNFVALFASW